MFALGDPHDNWSHTQGNNCFDDKGESTEWIWLTLNRSTRHFLFPNKEFFIPGIPAVIVGITAAARTKTYDMSQPIKEYFMCGALNFTSEVEQLRYNILTEMLYILKGEVSPVFLILNNFLVKMI